jgi:hypothetical protein
VCCGKPSGIDALSGPKLLHEQWVIADQYLLFHEEKSGNIFTEQFCTLDDARVSNLASLRAKAVLS